MSFLSYPGKPGVRSMGLDVRPSVAGVFFNFIDVTLVDGDINPIPTDEAKRAILGNVAMQVAPPGDQTCN